MGSESNPVASSPLAHGPPKGPIDLHIHTTASDGTLSPADVLREAAEQGLAAIAITDHDTTAGVRAALEAGVPPSMGFLPGVEISAAPPSSCPMKGSFHLLGYGVRLDHEPLNRCLEALQDSRRNRNPRILARLRELGIDLELDEAAMEDDRGQVGRPHIAGLLKEQGHVKSIEEAFDRYIGNHGPAYVDKYRVPVAEAIGLIRAAGGVAAAAHPGVLPLEPGPAFETMMAELREMGLRGVEVFHPEHSPERTEYFRGVARRFGLLMTGGTDFHGDVKPGVAMGRGRGDFRVPPAAFEDLLREVAGP
ncbi:MAG: PHP domain-containing protein [Desulfococcaceae bacterium]